MGGAVERLADGTCGKLNRPRACRRNTKGWKRRFQTGDRRRFYTRSRNPSDIYKKLRAFRSGYIHHSAVAGVGDGLLKTQRPMPGRLMQCIRLSAMSLYPGQSNTLSSVTSPSSRAPQTSRGLNMEPGSKVLDIL